MLAAAAIGLTASAGAAFASTIRVHVQVAKVRGYYGRVEWGQNTLHEVHDMTRDKP